MTDAVVVSIISSAATLAGLGLTALVNYKLGRLHKQLNSRMDELLAAAKKVGNAEGRAEAAKEAQK